LALPWRILHFLASTVPALLPGCAWTPVRPYKGGAAPISSVDVIAADWHTEIGVAAADIHGPLTVLVSDFAGRANSSSAGDSGSITWPAIRGPATSSAPPSPARR